MAKAVKASAAPGIVRRQVLDGKAAAHAGVSVQAAAPAARISLRAPEASLPALGKALGLALPGKPRSSSSSGDRSALWLGPDEWLVIDRDGADLMGALARVRDFHSAVDVSHRNVAILVDGPAAEAAISAGCPQDISPEVFPVGACSRTILGKVEIVLWRIGEHAFRVECWRSFADYAFTFLADAARDAAA